MDKRSGAMESLEMTSGIWSGRKVFITGHTGFKGGWLALWLEQFGAVVHGFALEPPTQPNLFEIARLKNGLAGDARGDIRDGQRVAEAMRIAQPEVVFHLAAQPLVRDSYERPVETYTANVMGTVHVLEAVRQVGSVRAVVIVTSDKCYENREWAHPYREVDRLGGHDPYSSSKACAELVAASYSASFFGWNRSSFRNVAIATARAGNVIGGGDWARDRLLPDCVRALVAGKPVQLRYPDAVRPWQHVFDPLAGYLLLADRLLGGEASEYSDAWNFGPDLACDAAVGAVAARVAKLWGGAVDATRDTPNVHEANTLRLDSTKARVRLGWFSRWPLDRALQETVAWYRAWAEGQDMRAFSEEQIHAYSAAS